MKNINTLPIPYVTNEKVNYISPGRPDSDLSVIIGTKYASDVLEKCLNNFFRNSDFSNEVIIVCNDPSWQTIKLLQERHLRYWNVHFNHAFMAVNFAAELATRKYVSFFADDILVGPGWDSALSEIVDDGVMGSLALIDGSAIRNERYRVGNSLIFGKLIAPEIGYDPQTAFIDDQKFDSWCKENSMDRIESFAWPPLAINRLDFLQDKFCFHGPHPSGHEINLANRYMKDGWKVKTSYKSFIYHIGHMGNRDGMTEQGNQFEHGLLICRSCGLYKEGIYEGYPDYKPTYETGYWLCESCRTKTEWKPLPHRRFL